MSTLLIKRANRVLLFSVAAIMIASMLAPLAAVANTDLVSGDTATVSNPDGTGAYLRSDTATLDDSTVIAELPQGAVVYVYDSPVYNDTGVWVYVSSEFGDGWISASLLVKQASTTEEVPAEETVTEEVVETEQAVSELSWLEPVDSGIVVDYNIQLSVDGLAVRTTASVDGPVLGYAAVGSSLDVTGDREWIGDLSFVRVNFNGVGGYVDGRFIELTSEATTEEPTEEVIWVDETPTEVVTEEVVETEPATEEVVETEVVTEEVVETEPVTEEVVETEVVTEEVVETEPVTEEVVETEVVTEEVVETEPVTEEVVETEVVTEEVVETEEAVETEPATTEEVIATESGTPEVTETEEVVVTEPGTPEVTETEEVVVTEPATPTVTETVPSTPVATETATSTAQVSPTATTAATTTPKATTAPAKTATVAPTKVVTPEATKVTTPAPIASNAKTFDAKALIGSATVTGTSNGLLCRTEPNPAAPVLMTLKEGTKVMVSAEAVNGYLGIDCGGLQGFADVNFLWSGGAGDGEINAAKMNVVVTGTGNGLNCRTGAGTSYPVITTIFDGTSLVTRGKAQNGWTPVTCGGKNGFVSTTWIEAKAGSSNSGSNSGASTGSATVNTGGDGLYCRSGAGTSYGVVTVLSHGATVTIRGAKQGEWIPVTCGGVNGFAHSSFLKISSGSGSNSGSGATGAATGNVTVANTGGQGLNCRSGAGTSHSIITTLTLGQAVKTRSGSTNGWTAVICGGSNGFVSSEFVSGGGTTTKPTTPTAPGGATGSATVNTGGDGLYCRSGSGSSYGIVTVLSHGTTVKTRGSAQNGWTPIVCGGSNGWASSQYLKAGGSTTTPPTTPTNPSGLVKGNHGKTTSSVNLRYSASTSSSVSTVVDAGIVVLVTGSVSNSFYPVNYDGLTGFIHKDYLVKTSAALSERGGSGTPDPGPTNPGPTTPSGNAMVSYAQRYLGYPYVWATHGPASFDCSGFTYWVAKNVTGKDIGYGTWTQVAAGSPVSKANLQPGDLVFFQNTYTAGLSHVGLYIGNGQFIHAQNEETGVVISDLNSSYYGPRWYGAVRL